MGVASKGNRDILEMNIHITDELNKFGNGIKIMKNGFAKQRLLGVENNLDRNLTARNCDTNAVLVNLVNSFERSTILDDLDDTISHTQGFKTSTNEVDQTLPPPHQRPRKLLLIGDSMIKYVDANRLMHTRKNDKLCIPGATIETIENEIVKHYKHSNNDMYTDVLVHVGTNNIPHDHPNIVINSLARLMHTVQKSFPRAEMYFSGIIPKYSNAYIIITDKINYALRNWCRVNGYHFVDTRGLFVNSKYRIRFDRLSKNDRLHLNRAGVQALAKYFTFYLNTLYGKLSTPTS